MTYNPLIHHRHSLRKKGYDYSSEGAYFVTICSHNPGNIFGHIGNGKMFLNEYGMICNDEWMKTANIRPNIELITHIVMPDHFHALFIIKQKSNQRYIGIAQNEIHGGECQFAPMQNPPRQYARMDKMNDAQLGTGKIYDEIHTGELQFAPIVGQYAPMDMDNTPMDGDTPIEYTFQSQYTPLTDDDINEIHKMPHSPSQTVGAIVRGFKSAATKQINILRVAPKMPVWQRNYHEYIITSERFFNNVANYILQNPGRWGNEKEYCKNICR